MATRAQSRLTPDAIDELATYLKQQYAPQDLQIDQGRRVRELTEVVALPSRLERVKGFEMPDPSLADEIKRIVSAVNSRPPKVVVTPADPQAERSQELSTRLENWFTQVLIEAQQSVNGEDAYERNIDACFGDGGAWMKVVYDKDRWEEVWETPDTEDYWADSETGDDATDTTPAPNLERRSRPKSARQYLKDREDAKKTAGVPIRMINVDVRTVYPLWRGTELYRVLEIQKRPVADLVSIYGKKADGLGQIGKIYGQPVSQQEGQQYGNVVDWVEAWTDTEVVYMADYGAGDRRILKRIQHGYGQLPWFFCPGFMMNWWRGRKVGWGIGQERVGLIKGRSFLWKLVVNIAAQVAGTPIQHTVPTDGAEMLIPDAEQPEGETDLIELSGVYEGKPGEKWEPIPLPGVPQAVNELLSILDARIAQLETPRLPVGGGDLAGAGFTYAQIIAEIKNTYDIFVKHMEQAYRAIMRFIRKLVVDVIKEPIYVYYSPTDPKSDKSAEWLGIGPDELSKPVGQISLKINADPPTAEIVKVRYWVELLQARLAYRDQAMEELGFNPDVVRRGQLIEQLRDSPEYMSLMKRELLRELQHGDLEYEAAMAAAQTGMLPGMDPALVQQMAAQVMGGGNLNQQLMQQQLMGAGRPMMPTPNGMGPGMAGAPGQPMVPDQAALAMAPGMQGAAPMANIPGGMGPGPTPGAPQVRLPSVAPGLQRLEPGR